MKNTLFMHYTIELKYRIRYTLLSTILTLGISYYYIEPILSIIVESFDCSFILYKPWELFITYLWIAFYIASIAFLIMIPIQVLLFYSNALTFTSSRRLYTYYISWIFLLILILIFHQSYIFPTVFDFFITVGNSSENLMFQASEQIALNLSILEFIKMYINTLLPSIILMTLSFIIQIRIGHSVENLNDLLRFRKIVYLIIGICLTFICPPDASVFIIYYIISLLLLEVSIIRTLYIKNKKARLSK